MTLDELQEQIDAAACLMCAGLSPETLGLLQLNQLSTISSSAAAGGEAPPSRYPTLGVANALAKEVVVKTGPGRLLTAMVTQKAGSDLYFQVHDASSVPADGAVPLLSVKAPSDILAWFDFGASGMPVATGIVLVLSTTFPTKTSGPVGATTGLFTATYR
jgi:hypothetical protein